MLFIPPPQFRKRRRLRFKPAQPPEPPPSGLQIVQVSRTDPWTNLTIFFSDTMNWDNSGVPTAFAAVTTNGIMEPCVAVAAADHLWIELVFPADVMVGAAWELTGAMEGITPDVAWPQSGIVT